jgi:phospholipid-translocating ATPase
MSDSNSPETGPDAKLDRIQTQRARWATRRLTVKSSRKKRLSLLNRAHHKRSSSNEKNGSDPDGGDAPFNNDNAADDDVSDAEPEENTNRSVFFNMPLPDDMVDEEGHPLYTYTRNKIRTAKYTPISFIPKNLWFQFHNVANIFFLFVVILVVSGLIPLLFFSPPPYFRADLLTL